MRGHVCRWVLPLLAAAGAAGQEGSTDRVTVPLRNPSRPYTLRASLMNGGITVRGYNGREMTIESRGHGGRSHPAPPRADGLRRLDLPNGAGLQVDEEEGTVTVKTDSWRGSVDLVVQVPVATSLRLRCMNGGDIVVERVSGDIDVDNLNGRVTLRDVSGTVVAHALNGELNVTMDRVDPNKPMSFSTLNGNIDVTLPADVRARLKLKADQGEVFSDFDMRLEATSSRSEDDSRPGRHRVRIDRSVTGVINGGGPEMQFTTLNGRIYVRKRK